MTTRLAPVSLLIVLAAALATAGCGDDQTSTPSCPGCTPGMNPTPFTPGQLPGSVAAVTGSRCGGTTSQLGVFGNQILATRIADPTTSTLTFNRNDGFVIYWSVCNVGGAPSAAVGGPPQGLNLVGPGGSQSFSWNIPALASCACVVPIPQAQVTAGLATAGSYTATLVGMFNNSATITIN